MRGDVRGDGERGVALRGEPPGVRSSGMRRRARMQVSRGWRAVAGISFVGATARQRGGRSGMRGVAPKRRAAGSCGALDERRDAVHDGCACNQLRRAASRV
ncbi:hypothetical protein ACRUKI_32635, partial [Burkholderia pseudomallei]